LQGNYDDAKAVLDAIPSDDPEIRVRVQLENGRVVNSSGDSEGALPLFGEAFGVAADAGFEFLAIDAVHMLAIVAPPDAQDAVNGQALKLAKLAGDPRARQWRPSVLNNMGWTAFGRGDLDAALGRFKAALKAREEHGKLPETLVARWCIARTLREMGRADEALAIQIELAEAHRATGTTDRYVDEEIAACTADLAASG
jgi:tetratricopeptide (TPR) repeat protein